MRTNLPDIHIQGPKDARAFAALQRGRTDFARYFHRKAKAARGVVESALARMLDPLFNVLVSHANPELSTVLLLHTGLGVLDVKAKGVKGDGTDESTALQAAFDAVTRGVVVIPPGDYSFGTTLTIPVGVHILGLASTRLASDGASLSGQVTLKYTGSGTAIRMSADAAHLEGFVLRDAGTGTIGIDINGRSRWHIENVSIEGFSTNGINATSGDPVLGQITRCRFSNNGTHIRGTTAFNAIVITRCEFMSATSYHVDLGGGASGCSGIVLRDCNHNGTIGGGYAIKVRSGVTDVTVVGFRHEPDDSAGFLQQDDNSFGLTIQSGLASGPSGSPSTHKIRCAGGDITVRDVTIGHATNGVTFDTTARRWIVERLGQVSGGAPTNFVTDNSTSTAKVYIDHAGNITAGAAVKANTLSEREADAGVTVDGTKLKDGGIDFATSEEIALGGGSAPTLGTIGGSGPAAAAQAVWVRVKINGVATYIPGWR